MKVSWLESFIISIVTMFVIGPLALWIWIAVPTIRNLVSMTVFAFVVVSILTAAYLALRRWILRRYGSSKQNHDLK